MADSPVDAVERDTTNLSREGLGAYIRTQLRVRSTKSVEVYKRGSREFTRTWRIAFEYSSENIASAD